MKKVTKAPKLKVVVVKCAKFWEHQFEIDSDIFDDIYMEAATRAIEKLKDEEFKLTIVLECWEQKDADKPDKHFCYNSYFVLVNAGLHQKAEMLRMNFLQEHQLDIQKESIKSLDNNNGNSNNTPGGNPSLN